MTDRAVQVGTRDGSLNANPIGTPPKVDKSYPEFSLYLNDSWKVGPSLTMNLGLNWSADVPQTEVDGKESLGYYLSGGLIDPEELPVPAEGRRPGGDRFSIRPSDGS